jgi:hypothetical protein
LVEDKSEELLAIVSAFGKPAGVRAERLLEIEQLFGTTVEAQRLRAHSVVRSPG